MRRWKRAAISERDEMQGSSLTCKPLLKQGSGSSRSCQEARPPGASTGAELNVGSGGATLWTEWLYFNSLQIQGAGSSLSWSDP